MNSGNPGDQFPPPPGHDPQQQGWSQPGADQGWSQGQGNGAQGYGSQPQGYGSQQHGQGYGSQGQGYGSQGQYAGAGYGAGQQGASGPQYAAATPQPAPAPGYAGGPGGGGAPAKKKSKLPLFLSLGAVALVVILVVVGFIVIGSVNKSKYGPDATAEEYLTALQEGDIDKANELAKPVVPNGANEQLLDPKYAAGSSEKITDATVVSTDKKGDEADVTATYKLGGQDYELKMHAKKDGKQNVFFDKWVLTGPVLQTIAIDVPPIDGVKVNDVDFKPGEGRTEYAVLPGNYAVSIPGSKFVEAASDQVTVGFSPNDAPTAAEMSMPLKATSAFQTEVSDQVKKKIEECAADKSLTSKCSFMQSGDKATDTSGKSLAGDLKKDSASYKVRKFPQVTATLGGDGAVGSFFTSTAGSYDVRFDSKTAGKYYFKNGIALSPSGTVKINGDKLEIDYF